MFFEASECCLMNCIYKKGGELLDFKGESLVATFLICNMCLLLMFFDVYFNSRSFAALYSLSSLAT